MGSRANARERFLVLNGLHGGAPGSQIKIVVASGHWRA
jgi:hypothetical protein